MPDEEEEGVKPIGMPMPPPPPGINFPPPPPLPTPPPPPPLDEVVTTPDPEIKLMMQLLRPLLLISTVIGKRGRMMAMPPL